MPPIIEITSRAKGSSKTSTVCSVHHVRCDDSQEDPKMQTIGSRSKWKNSNKIKSADKAENSTTKLQTQEQTTRNKGLDGKQDNETMRKYEGTKLGGMITEGGNVG